MSISTEQARENGKKGGRPKGAKGTAAREVRKFVDKVFAKLDPEKFAIELLNCNDEKIRATVFLRLLEYRYGRPMAQLDPKSEENRVSIEGYQSAKDQVQMARKLLRQFGESLDPK
jgi:hypothetical protein